MPASPSCERRDRGRARAVHATALQLSVDLEGRSPTCRCACRLPRRGPQDGARLERTPYRRSGRSSLSAPGRVPRGQCSACGRSMGQFSADMRRLYSTELHAMGKVASTPLVQGSVPTYCFCSLLFVAPRHLDTVVTFIDSQRKAGRNVLVRAWQGAGSSFRRSGPADGSVFRAIPLTRPVVV